MINNPADLAERIAFLSSIGIAMSREKNKDIILERILRGAMELTNADGATLYLLSEDQLKFSLVINRSLNIHLRNSTHMPSTFHPIPLHHTDGSPNYNNVVAYSILHRKTVNIVDAYDRSNLKYDFSGTHKFDKTLCYHSKSFLTIPMINHLDEVIGGFQLINAIDADTKSIISFTETDETLIETLSSHAAIVLTLKQLLQEQKDLFEGFIKVIAEAIDEKSEHTSAHCQRVPIISQLIAEGIQKDHTGRFKDVRLTDDDIYELKIAAWLHDCGKLATPDHIMNKNTKLSMITDKVELIQQRSETIRANLELSLLKKQLSQEEYQTKIEELNDTMNLIAKLNIGGEVISQDNQMKLLNAKKFFYLDHEGKKTELLTDEELNNLSVERGTLNTHERQMIQHHVEFTAKMLQSLVFPRALSRVPEIASSHHERLDGKGYPLGLKSKDLSLQARIIALADVFEALTAKDRPYKKAKTLTETLAILNKMKMEKHLDPNLIDLFLEQKIYDIYLKRYGQSVPITKIS